MNYDRGSLSDEKLLFLYRALLLPRMIEEKMLLLLRKGRISKWFSGIGQEAISVGVTQALDQDEFILPLHRNLGVFTGRKMPLEKLFAQLQGKYSGFSKGRERSFHFGSTPHHIVGMISHLGPQLSVGAGIALGKKLKAEKKITVAFTGEGGTSEGEFHEALNVAAVWNLPIIFLIENNGYGLSTPSREQFATDDLKGRAAGYGMEGVQIDGNNILEVFNTINILKEEILENPRPVLLECMTFRMRGHEEASGVKYVPQALFDEWGKKDPVSNYQEYLQEQGLLTLEAIADLRKEMASEIDNTLNEALDEKDAEAHTAAELADIYHEHTFLREKGDAATHQENDFLIAPASSAKTKKRLVDAVSDGLRQSMERYENLIIMGQDVAEYGGVFKVTEGFLEQFGRERVRNTPLCESAILGMGLGLSIEGYKSVIEMQFADFVTCGFNQIINNLAKIHYRWGQNADVVVRMPTGAGVGAGPFHSQSNEAWFFHTPGLKVVYPSSPSDAKGLLAASIEDPNPVMFFEHKALYRSISEEIFDDYYTIELGKARCWRNGDEVSIITYGAGVHWALEVLNIHPGISADLIDLRTLLPWDQEAVKQSVLKTGKAIILHEDTLTGGIGGEIAAWISEHCFEHLDAPVKRVASLDTPVPMAPKLEANFLAKSRFEKALVELVGY
ncbi:MAG: dehydrogenase E1 component subunit alpha/beta [Bacteroidia bacterium]